MVRIDVAVAGGGPAGLAAAIAARRKGLSVAVFEGVLPAAAIDKCCGEGLMPEALDALGELGIDRPALWSAVMRRRQGSRVKPARAYAGRLCLPC